MGRRVGVYELQALLGAGGMGEVYRARDTKLGREVAIKILPHAFTADPDRLARFEREARVLATLNHPNIGAIYGFEDSDDVRALVLELVEGQTLAERIAAGGPEGPPLRVEEALAIVRQIADALDAAHEKGIVHRDLKPANIKITPDGVVKVLDFGLAKAAAGDGSAPDLSQSPTVTIGGTREGMILGTAAYMSPEQARGKPVDKRTDIWAFGCVLYEMLTGCVAFAGETMSDTIAAILEREPDWKALPPQLPPAVRHLLRGCLEKDARQRLRDIGDARIEIRHALTGAAPATVDEPAHPQRGLLSRIGWSVAGGMFVIALLLASGVGLVLWQTESVWKNPFENARFSRLTDFAGAEVGASISADGKFVVFLSDRDGPLDAWVTQVGTGEFRNLTAGLFPDLANENVRNVGFSADASKVWLAISNAEGGFDDWRVPIIGGASKPFINRAVGEAPSPDGSRIAYHGYSAGDPIFVADRDGSDGKQIFVDKPGYHNHFLTWSPDGRYIYFVRGAIATRQMDIWRIPATGGEPDRITHHLSWVVSPAALDNRTLIYSSPAEDGSGPWLYAIDVERRVPHRVSLGVEQYTSISATADGRRLVASVANPIGHLWSLPILDRPATEAETLQVQLPNVRAVSPRYGRDYFLYLSSQGGGNALWKSGGGAASELWKGGGNGQISSPAVSSDGRNVAFTVRKAGRGTLYAMNAEGTGVRTLADSLDVSGTPSFSPDGKWIVVAAVSVQGPHIFKVALEGGPPVQLVNEPGSNPVWSPNGGLIIYSGPGVSIRMPLKAVSPEGKPVPVPLQDRWVRSGGERYRFMPDGRALVFMRGEWNKQDFYLLDLATGRERQLSNMNPGFLMWSFDTSPDGKRILFDRVRDNADVVLIDVNTK